MATENVPVNLDDVLKKLGHFGKYTIYNYALLMLPAVLSGLISVAYNFEALDINYRCEMPECEGLNNTLWLEYALPQEKGQLSKCKVFQHNNDTTDQCSIEAFDATIIEDCDTYVYSEQDSVVKDFNLGCQNWKRTLIGTIHNMGYFIALPLTGFISDKYGRTVALSIASLMNGIFGIARSFSTTYNMMLVFEFLESALGAGHYTCIFVMVMELARPKERPFLSNVINFFHVIGLLILTALAWWLQSWRSLLRVIFSVAFIPTFYFILLKESPRWLISKGRYEQALAVLRNAAKMNKVEIPEDMLNSIYSANNTQERDKTLINKDIHESIEHIKKPSLFWQVIKSKIITIRLIVCSLMWMSASFIYYGLSINSVSLAGNKYQNFMLASIVEIPANFMVYLLLDRLGRKLIISATFLLSGCMCISLSLLPKDQRILLLILYLFGKFFGTMAYSSIYVYIAEVFPTSVRQSLMSFCSTMGRFGTTLAPLTPLLAFYYKNLPAIFFGGVALIASILTLIPPETIKVTLPDTIEEAEKMSKRKVDGNTKI